MSTLHTNEPMQGLAEWLRMQAGNLEDDEPACWERNAATYVRWAEAVESLAAQAKAPASVQDTAPSEALRHLNALLDVVGGLLEWVRAIPQDAQLSAMPGLDGDYIASVVGSATEFAGRAALAAPKDTP